MKVKEQASSLRVDRHTLLLPPRTKMVAAVASMVIFVEMKVAAAQKVVICLRS